MDYKIPHNAIFKDLFIWCTLTHWQSSNRMVQRSSGSLSMIPFEISPRVWDPEKKKPSGHPVQVNESDTHAGKNTCQRQMFILGDSIT